MTAMGMGMTPQASSCDEKGTWMKPVCLPGVSKSTVAARVVGRPRFAAVDVAESEAMNVPSSKPASARLVAPGKRQHAENETAQNDAAPAFRRVHDGDQRGHRHQQDCAGDRAEIAAAPAQD